MPLFLVTLFTTLGNLIFQAIVWFITRGGIRFTAALVLIGLVGAAINLLVSETDALIGQLLPGVTNLVSFFMPTNASICVSAIIATELSCTAYRLTLRFIEMKSKTMIFKA